MMLRKTPFHAPAADLNRDNAWLSRNGTTLASHYTSAEDEALAARLRVVMADISWRWRIALSGPRVGEMLSRVITRDPAKLASGDSLKALWLNDGGAVRGAGVFARDGEELLVASAASDVAWFAKAAAPFDVRMEEQAGGGLAVIGPYAAYVLRQAGLDPELPQLHFRKVHWHGTNVVVSRWGEHGGYEIWCGEEDGALVWDAIARAGENFAIQTAGVNAMDILDIEAGVLRPQRDYEPARGASETGPTPQSLGLERLIDSGHTNFNGRLAWLKPRSSERRTLVGIEIASAQPAPNTPLRKGERIAGHILASCYSPALRRAIGIAQVDTAAAAPGSAFSLLLAPTREHPDFRKVAAQAAGLPFLPAPDPLLP